jgi:hypothetical protein
MKVHLLAPYLVAAVFGTLILGGPLEAQTRRRGPGTLSINSRTGLSQSYNVNGQSVTVRGSGNRIRLTGHSPSVRVSGTNNHVYVDAAYSISVSGRNNRVYWRRLYNGKPPRISRTGTRNQVTRSRSR